MKDNKVFKILLAFSILGIVTYLVAMIVGNFQSFSIFKSLSIQTDLSYANEICIANANIELTMAITNLVILLIVIAFSILYLLKVLDKKNILMISIISTVVFCIEIFFLQRFITYLIMFYMPEQEPSPISFIAPLICFICIMACYISFIFKIKTKKVNCK